MAVGHAMLGEVLWPLWQETRHSLAEMLRPGTPEFAMLVWPHIAYWAVAIYFDVLDRTRVAERYKVVRRDPGRPNALSVGQVVRRVLVQQAMQAAFTLCLNVFDPGMCPRHAAGGSGLLARIAKFILGMYVMDAWQYFIHRLAHTSTFLYKHVHAVHHTLLIPYAYGALYNSVFEGLALDTLGGGVVLWTTGIDCWTATLLFTFGTAKTVLDHSGYRWPVNPLHGVFPNSSAFHDVHHDIRYIKTNFSQPFFTHWDWLLGTFVDPADVHLSQEELDRRLAAQPAAAAASGKKAQ